MKNNIVIFSFVLAVSLLSFLSSCKKEVAKVVPTVTIIEVTTVTGNSASIKISIVSDGGSAITEMGILWSMSPSPGIDGNKAITVPGNSVCYITGLTPVTTYYFEAYATNSVGTAFSSRSTFTTLASSPVLTTSDVTGITSTSAICGGAIPNDGGAAVTSRGICWSMNQNPTTVDNNTSDGTGSGSFTSSLSGLTPGTTYYIRAYANNNVGTAYGNQVTLTTDLADPGDYLPLMVGAKYKYSYTSSYAFVDENSREKGECTWNIISKSVDTPVVYQVEQSFSGYYVRVYYTGKKDSTQIENQITTLNFEVLNDRNVTFTIPVPYWGDNKVIFDRFIRSDKIDTCFTLNALRNYLCLKKNVGITYLSYFMCGNHCSSVNYTLIEGPY